MRYDIVLAAEAIEDYKGLDAHVRAKVRDGLDLYLQHDPTKVSKSRIKRLRGVRRPQYRLRIDDVRVFYDVTGGAVEVLAIVSKPDAAKWLARTGEMKRVALSEVKDDLSRYLRIAEKEEVVITRHGKPAGLLRGFASEDAWFEYRLENDPRFLRRIESARRSVRTGRTVPIENLR